MRFLNPILDIFFKDEDDKRRLVKVIIPSFIIQSCSVLLSFGISVLLARGLGAAEYGIFTYVFSIVFLVVNLSSYGLNLLVVREASAILTSGNQGLLKGFSRWSLRTLLLACIVLAIITGVLTYYFHLMPDKSYTLPMLIAAIAIPFYGLLAYYSSFLRGMHKIVLALLNDSIIKHVTFFAGILMLYLVAKKLDLVNIVWLNTITFGISFLTALLIFNKTAPFKQEKSQYDVKNWWKKLSALFLLNGLISLDSRIDIVMLGYLKDPVQVGIFTCASKIAVFLSFFLVTMNFIIGPAISRLSSLNEKQKLQQMITKTIRWVVLLSVPVYIVIVLLSKWIMGSFFGKDFEQGQIALIILCSAQLISILFGPVGNIMIMTGNEKYNAIYTFCSMVVTIILNFILIPFMGYNGAAISTACGIILWNAAMYVTGKKKLSISSWIFG